MFKSLNKRQPLLVLIILLGSSLGVRADQVDDYIRNAMQKRRIPGLAVAVVKDGTVIKAQGYGVSNLETNTPVTPDTVFELASLTKQFTATAIMILVEDGKVNLDEKVSNYLEKTPDSWKNITVRHLLTHTSGLPTLGKDFRSLVWTLNITRDAMYEAARNDALGFAPGDNWDYSDVGYFLLGMIIERVSGQKYADFLDTRIFKPTGMTDTSVLNQLKIIKNRARGYTILNNELVNIRRDYYVEVPSHYGIMSTALDLAKWDLALRSEKLLKQSSLKLMWTPVKLNNGKTYSYGFGWDLVERNGHAIVEHTGVTGTQITRFVNDSLTVIVLTNLGRWSGDQTNVNPWGITTKIAEFYIPELVYRPIPDREPQLTALIKDLFGPGIETGWDQKLFTPEIWPELKTSLAANLKSLKSLGPLRSIELVEQTKEGENQLYRYRLKYDQRFLLLSLTRNPAGKFVAFATKDEGPNVD